MMMYSLNSLAFIGPGGPELIVIMLVLLLVFGSKDAPRVFRKINEFINQMRNTADSFKREVMYSDIIEETPQSPPTYEDDDLYDHEHDEDYDYDESDDELERDYSDDTFQHLEEDLNLIDPEEELQAEVEQSEGDDVQKA